MGDDYRPREISSFRHLVVHKRFVQIDGEIQAAIECVPRREAAARLDDGAL